MGTARKRSEGDERMLDRLRAAGDAWAHAAAEEAIAARSRDRLICAASAMGISRRKVAEAAGVTAGRVQQILSRD